VPVTVEEKFESRLVTTGQNASAELRYVVRGTNDDVEARTALVNASPLVYDLYNTGIYLLVRQMNGRSASTTTPAQIAQPTPTYGPEADKPIAEFEPIGARGNGPEYDR